MRKHHAAVVQVHDELLVAHGEPALEPAGGVEDEIRAGQDAAIMLATDSCMAWPSATLEAVRWPPQRRGQAEPPTQLGDREGREVGLRRAEGGRAGLEVHGGQEVAVDHRGAGTHQLAQRDAGHGLGVGLGQEGRLGHRSHGAAQDEGRDHDALVGPGIGLERARHDLVVDQGRVDVDVALDHAGGFEVGSAPNARRAMAIESSARSGAVTAPMKGLVE